MRDLLESEETSPTPNDGNFHREVGTVNATPEAPGKYSGVRDFARGGMGRVLIARDEHLGRDIIIKELLGEAGKEEESTRADRGLKESTPMAARFVREARIAGQLEHPSIVPVHELGVRENGDLYYTMKYVRGQSMSEAIREASSLKQRLALLPHVLDTCQAIAYAHSRGVIHRDIKPANIMVGEFGETVVLDWGLARFRELPEYADEDGTIEMPLLAPGGSAGATATGQVLGTPAYMAPEQVQGGMAQVDERTDVYALGALIFSLLTGKPPHSGDNRDDAIRHAAAGRLTSIHDVEPAAPAELVAICEKAMAKVPTARYPSARVLAEELSQFLTGGLVSAYHYRISQRAWRLARNYRGVLVTAAVALAAIFALAIGAYIKVASERDVAKAAHHEAEAALVQSEKAQDAAKAAQREAEVREAAGRRELYARQIALAEVALNGDTTQLRALLHECPPELREWEWYYLWNISDSSRMTLYPPEVQEIVKTAAAPSSEFLAALRGFRIPFQGAGGGWSFSGCAASFSQDATRIVSNDRRGQLLLWDAGTGKLLETLQLGGGPVRCMAIDPQGRRAALGLVNFGLECWDLNEMDLLWSQQDDQIFTLAFSPDGDMLAAGISGRSTRLYDAASGAMAAELPSSGAHALVFSLDGRHIASHNQNKELLLLDLKSEKSTTAFGSKTIDEYPLAFARNGRHLLAGTQTFRLWDAEKGTELHRFEGHQKRVVGAVFSPDETRIASAGEDGTVRVWDAQSGDQLLVLHGHQSKARSVAFSSDGNHLVSAAAGTVKVWDLRSSESMRILGQSNSIGHIAFDPQGKLLVVSHQSEKTRFLDLENMRSYHPSPELESPARSSFFSPVGRVLLSARPLGGRNTPWRFGTWAALVIYKFPGGQELWRSTAFTGYDAAAISPGGNLLAHVAEDGISILVRDVATGEKRATLRGHMRPILTLAFDRARARIVSGGDDYLVKVWDIGSSRETLTFHGHTSRITNVRFSPDDSCIASSSIDGTVQLWDPETGRAFAPPARLSGSYRLAFSPDGRRVATGGEMLHILDRETGQRLLSLRMVSGGRIRSLAFSPDGQAIATSTEPTATEPGVDSLWIAAARESVEAKPMQNSRVFDETVPPLLKAPFQDTCRDRLERLDRASVAWAEVGKKSLGDAPPPLHRLEPFDGGPPLIRMCPSGGSYALAPVGEFPNCTMHGELEVPPVMLAFALEHAAKESDPRKIAIAKARFEAALPEDAEYLGRFARNWVKGEIPAPVVAQVAASKAVELEPTNKLSWRVLGYTELLTGRKDEAVDYFRNGYEPGYEPAAVGLALALITRGSKKDLEEALNMLEAQPGSKPTSYTEEALQALEELSPNTRPGIRERIRALLEAHLVE